MAIRSCIAAFLLLAGCAVDGVRFSSEQVDAGVDAPAEPQSRLTVTKVGEGTVTSVPAAIDCGSTCTYLFPTGTSVTLTATPSNGFIFSGWSSSDCRGTAPCTQLLVGESTSITATFFRHGSATFTASGDFTVPAGVSMVRVLAIGGGGGGANGHQGGGGSGRVATAMLTVTPGAVVPVTVGAPGLGAALCNNCNEIIGNTPGGASSFGALLSAAGGNTPTVVNGPGAAGGSGGGGSCNSGPTGGAGGSAGSNGGACTYVGGAGQGSFAMELTAFTLHALSAAPGGAGGAASHAGGGGGGGIFVDGAGPNASDGASATFSAKGGKGYGAGGGGGSYDGSGVVRFAGGNGARGLVYVEW